MSALSESGNASAADRNGDWLRRELLRRSVADQEARSAVRRGEADALTRTMRIDDENSAWMREVIAEWGWPGRSLVGEDAAHAAWLLAQHADRDPSLQKRCLALLADAVRGGEAAAPDLAFLTDRVLLASGEMQIYGTQIAPREGRFAANRLRDPSTVELRRAAVGLGSLEAYLRGALDLYGPPSPTRIICPDCKAEMEVWLPEPGSRSRVECPACHTIHVIYPSIPKTPEVR